MTLEHQVTNLEISKHLKELGVSQKSQFYHGASGVMFQPLLPNQYVICSAFTVAELGEMLPFYFSGEKHSNDWRCGFANNDGRFKNVPFVSADTEADARGKMLVYLLENKLITI